MLGLVLAVLVTAWMVYMIARKGYPVVLLLLSGIALMLCAVIFHLGPIVPAKESTGNVLLDVFDVIRSTYAARLAGLGLSIMCIGGFSRYMEHINASQALFNVFGGPLSKIHSPYLLLWFAFLVAECMALFVPDASGHNLLLMVTLYPILIRLGASRLSALGVIASSHFLDMGPGSGNSILAASIVGVDPSSYFLQNQLPVIVPAALVIATTNFFVQRWWDKREGPDTEGLAMLAATQTKGGVAVPSVYALLPLVPLVLLLFFSPVVVSRFGIKLRMDPATAMIISTIVAMGFEYVRLRKALPVLASFKVFYEGAGRQFVVVVSLICAGEIYAHGLISVGALNVLISGAQSVGLGPQALAVISSCITTLSAFFMGSGNAAFFSFGPLLPEIAHHLGTSTLSLVLPIQMTAGIGRTASPIAGALVAIAGIAGVSSFQVAKRTAIPMAVAFVVVLTLSVMF